MPSDDKPLTLPAFAEYLDIGIRRARDMAKKPGFPMIDGIIFPSDFVLWRRKYLQLDTSSGHPPSTFDKSDEPVRRNDSPASSRHREERLREAFGLPS